MPLGKPKGSGVVYAAMASLGGVGISENVGRGVAAAHAAGLLQQAIVYGRRGDAIPDHLVTVLGFHPYKLFSWLPARYYYFIKRQHLARAAARYLRRHGAALFHGLNNECLEALTVARELGAVLLVERHFCHPRHNLEILSAEYRDRGIVWPPPSHPWLKSWDHWTQGMGRSLKEIDLADYLMVPSQFAKDTFVSRGTPPEKVIFQPQGVDLGRFQPQPAGDGVFRVLYVGLLCFRKGLPYLLEAWDRLNLKGAELLLVGTVHDDVKPFLARFRGRPDIKITGFNADPAALFAGSSVFCLPSLSEGGAKVTYEALAAGLPQVVTPEAGSVVQDGVEGLLIPPRQVEPLMAALEQLYSHQEQLEEMSRRARQRAQEFTWEAYARRLVDFYRRALASPRP
jgi:glycosyltransferase involved in cell wall biosynthesis